MKVGDIVALKNLDKSWGEVALVTRISRTSCGTGQIHLIAGGMNATIPLIKKDEYIVRVVNDTIS